MQTHRPTLLWFVTTWLIALIEGLRSGFQTNIEDIIYGAGRATPETIARVMKELMRGEAKLLKAIRNGALRELGYPIDRRPWQAFRQSQPQTRMAFATRLNAYRHMLSDPEACVQRLVAKVRADMRLSTRDRMREPMLPSAPPVIATRIAPLLTTRCVQRTAPLIHPP